MKKLYRMQNQIQKYEWGSSDYIANLLQVEKNDDSPWAELWMSAHDKAPSYLPDVDQNLDKAIAKNPKEFLGDKVASQYNHKLPYLFKILSAKKPLSIQAHPNLEEAQRGFAHENQLGIHLTDFIRNYKDDNHKPELICALTEFHAMCGFRPAKEIIEFITQLNILPFLDNFTEFVEEPNPENWKILFSELLTAPVEKKQQIIEKTVKNFHLLSDDFIRSWISKLLIEHPNDIGVISPLFLNTFVLQPGQAIFLEAGVLHAYLSGTGVEIMANSDNVLRGGLTSKNIDVNELTNVLKWDMKKADIQAYDSNQEIINYQVPINEFCLKRINLAGKSTFNNGNPTMLLVINGEIEVTTADEAQVLKQGQTLFITSEADIIILSGKGLLYLASTNCHSS